MPLAIVIFFVCLAAVFAIIAVHECGHYVAGLVGGIPRRAMRIRLLTFPQHVALEHERRWLHPNRDYDRYVAASMFYLSNRKRAFLYVAAGLLIQTVAFVLVVGSLFALGVPRFWIAAVTTALASVPVIYFCSDLLCTAANHKPCGDYSFLWRISPPASIALTTFVLAVHGTALFHVLRSA